MSCSHHFQSFALKETIALYALNPNCSWMILSLPIKSLNMPSIPWQQTISINDVRQRNMNCFVFPNPDNTVYINIIYSHMCQHLLFYLKYSAPTTLHWMTSYCNILGLVNFLLYESLDFYYKLDSSVNYVQVFYLIFIEEIILVW